MPFLIVPVVFVPAPGGTPFEPTQVPTMQAFWNNGAADVLLAPLSAANMNPDQVDHATGIPTVMAIRGDEGTIGLTPAEDSPVPTVDIELNFIPTNMKRGDPITVKIGYNGADVLMFTGGIQAVGDQNPDFAATQCFVNGASNEDGTKVTGLATATLTIPIWPPIPAGQELDFTRDNPYIWDDATADEVAVREAEDQARVPSTPTGSMLALVIHCTGDLHGAYSAYKVPERDMSGQQIRDAIRQAYLDAGVVDVNTTDVPDYALRPVGATAQRMSASQLAAYLMQIKGCRPLVLRTGTLVVAPLTARPSETGPTLTYSTEDPALARVDQMTGELRVPFNPDIHKGDTVHFTLRHIGVDGDYFISRHRWELSDAGFWSYLTAWGGEDFGTTVAPNPRAMFTASVIFELLGPALMVIIHLDATGSYDPAGGGPITGDQVEWTDNQTPPLISGSGLTKDVIVDPTTIVGDYIPSILVTAVSTLTGSYSATIPIPSVGTAQRLPAVAIANLTKASYSPDGEQTWNSQDVPDCNVTAARPADGVHYGHAIFGSTDGAIVRTQDGLATPPTTVLASAGGALADMAWDWRNTLSAWALRHDDAAVFASIDQAGTFGLYGGMTLAQAIGASTGLYRFKLLTQRALHGWDGANWHVINDTLPGGDPQYLQEIAGHSFMILQPAGAPVGELWHSPDGGTTWEQRTVVTLPFGGSDYYGVLRYDLDDAGNVYILETCPDRSTDTNGFNVQPARVRMSSDWGETWTLLHTLPASVNGTHTNTIGIPLYLAVSSDGQKILVMYRQVSQAGAVERSYSADGGGTWAETIGASIANFPNVFATSQGTRHWVDGAWIYLKGYTSPRVYRSATDGSPGSWSLALDLTAAGGFVAFPMSWWRTGDDAVFISATKNTSGIRTRILFSSPDAGLTWTQLPGFTGAGQNNFGIAYDVVTNHLMDIGLQTDGSGGYSSYEFTDPLGTPTWLSANDPNGGLDIAVLDTVCVARNGVAGGVRLLGGRLGLPVGAFGETPLFVFGGEYDITNDRAYPLIAVDVNLTNSWSRISVQGGELWDDVLANNPPEGLYISAAAANSLTSGGVVGLANAGGLAPAYYQPPGFDPSTWVRCVGLPAGVDVVAIMGDSPIVGDKVFRILMADGSIHSTEDGINYTETRAAPIETDFTPTDGIFLSDVLTGIQNFSGIYMVAMQDAGATGLLEKSVDTFATLNPIWPAGGAYPAWPGGGAKPQRISIGGAAPLPP